MPAGVIQDVQIKLNVVQGTVQLPKGLATTASPSGVAGGVSAPAKGTGGGGGGLGIGGLLGAIGLPALTVAGGLGAVSAAQPGVFAKFTETLNDIAGVIGHTLAPVLEVFTEGLRLFGDLLQSILPTQEQMTELMKPVRELLKSLTEVFQELLPILRPLIDLWLSYAKVIITIVVGAIKVALAALKSILQAFGFDAQRLQSSFGAAARPTSSVGIAALGQQARLAAFSVGQAATREDRRDNLFEKIAKDVAKITDVVVKYAEKTGEVAHGLNLPGAMSELAAANRRARSLDEQVRAMQERHRDALQGKQ